MSIRFIAATRSCPFQARLSFGVTTVPVEFLARFRFPDSACIAPFFEGDRRSFYFLPMPAPSHPQFLALGLDFGTTNTVVATSNTAGAAQVLPFTLDSRTHATFRSAMCFWDEDSDASRGLRFEAGPWAIERFIDDPLDCRFLQSFKTFAASKSFTETHIHGKKFTFEDLLTAFIEKLRAHAGPSLADLPLQLVAGRPVAFAGVNPNETLALERYERAFKRVGFAQITYVYEPVAAAYFFAQRLTQAATVLVADFGGGTSDFSIIRFEPGLGGDGTLKSIPLAHSGVAVAGDVFDYRILEHAILPQRGKQFRRGEIKFNDFTRWQVRAFGSFKIFDFFAAGKQRCGRGRGVVALHTHGINAQRRRKRR